MTPDQEPRTGGVAVVIATTDSRNATIYRPRAWYGADIEFEPERVYALLPLAEAEALIDPNDPKTRATIRERAADRVDAAIFDWMGLTPSDEMVSETIDAVLAAFRGAK